MRFYLIINVNMASILTDNYSLQIKHLIEAGEVKTYYLRNVSPDSTIKKLKRIIALLYRVPVEDQRLLYKTKRLQDDFTLVDYEIGNNATIHLVFNRQICAEKRQDMISQHSQQSKSQASQ